MNLKITKTYIFQAFPPAKFLWQFENVTRTIRRTDGGTYTCTAFNDIGNVKAESKDDYVKHY